jgi:5-methylcytosine-specific restriction endonuclease McrA
MQIAKSRKEAVAGGLLYYEREKPCKQGHAPIYLVSGSCLACSRKRDLEIYHSLDSDGKKLRANYAKNRVAIRSRQSLYYRTKGKSEAFRRAAEWVQRHPVKRKAARDRYKQNNPAMYRSLDAARRARQANAMPAWADKEAILRVYEEARRLTLETKITHHVDHIVPLFGKNVCGLHVAWNLQVLTASENYRKSNLTPT